MKIALWSVTRGAGLYAKEICKKISGDIYTLKKFDVEDTYQMEDFTQELNEKFNSYDSHIFIMASGIVMRKVAPLIKSKDIDPAVLVIDEGRNFIISLLSGHLGGANELTKELSEKLNLVPVITTSSDVTGKIAVDTISQKLKGELDSLESAKKVTALIVDGKPVKLMLPKNMGDSENPQGIILASNRENIEIARIYPRNLVIGVGCRRGISKGTILDGIKKAMEKNNLSVRSIRKFATVDVKADEVGLLEAVKEFNREIEIISRDEIKKIEDRFEPSEFVRSQIGVGAVSEPCAYLASNKNGKFIEKKYIYERVTISIYEEAFGSEHR